MVTAPADLTCGGASCRQVQRQLPSGTVSFLFTDVEGSTKLLHSLGAVEYSAALMEHRRILREAFSTNGGVEVDAQGDAFFVAFPTASGALAAAAAAIERLAAGPIRVRIGIHTGAPEIVDEGYVGVEVHRAARIAACGHGGQVLFSSSTAALVGTEGLRDLGEHRLKDLSAAERIYQLGQAEFGPLRSLYQTNLPIPATPFLGRTRELAEVVALLAQPEVRLLTLTGPGGTGKTRLGLQAAAETAERHPDGVFWVPLAPLRESEFVLETAAQELGAKDNLAKHIGDKSLFVLFDNFEHVVGAAPRLSELLAACPNVQLLVTSRELLRVPGEQAYPVPTLEPEDGARLFLARARAALPAFVTDDAVPELCTRLEHLPLALELAAARVRILSPKHLLERLSNRLDLLKAGRGVDPRQRTLRATIEWSHELLNVEEQQLFARLAVFAGGCALETAEDVCDADLDTLQSLVDKSLVRVRAGDRFGMLETIREYASERLQQLPAADTLRKRHAEHFLALAEATESNLVGLGSHAEWLDRFEREHDNFRAALDWFEGRGETDRALRLAAALWRFWDLRGHLVEGRRRLESALRADDRPTAARAKALSGAADMALGSGDVAIGGHWAGEALALNRKLGDDWGTAFSLMMVAYVTGQQGDWTRATELFDESVQRFRELGDQHYALRAARALAWAYEELGDLERSRQVAEDTLREARGTHDEWIQGVVLNQLAACAVGEGRLDDAVSLLKESYRIHCELGDGLFVAVIVCRFAAILALAGRPRTAASVLSTSAVLLEGIGARPPWIAKIAEGALASIRAQLDEGTFADASERGMLLTADEAVALALDALG
jgi:predicted ATPase/class 3 adenylate cyclase